MPKPRTAAPKQDPFFAFCRALPATTEDVKWGDNLVFSVGKKMYAVFDLPDGAPFSMKVDDETFALLTQQPGIKPAPYLARHSWIAIDNREVLSAEIIESLLREAHRIVASKLSRKLQLELGLA